MSDFWDDFTTTASLSGVEAGDIDAHLSAKDIGGDVFESVRALTDVDREANALELPVVAGTKVEFAGDLGTLLAYTDAPDPKTRGTVVAVKTATGKVTSHEGMVFVEWPDGETRAIHAEHLRKVTGHAKRQAGGRMRVASLGDLTDFLKLADDTLVHKSTQDLWAVRQDTAGYVIERLFDNDGSPLKA